jgi:hypothetical protein
MARAKRHQATEYRWGAKAYAADPRIIGATVASIAEQHGACRPQDLVEVARDEDHPAHKLFTWDDTTAATNWRTHEARRVINCLVVVVEGAEPAPAFVSVGHTSATEADGAGYRPISVVVADPAYRQEALEEALGRLNALRRRYEAIQALAPVWAALDSVAA